MAVNKVSFNTAGGEEVLIDLTEDSATPDAVFEGTTFHGADGEKKAGTFTITPELTAQGSLIDRIKAALQGKAAGGLPTQEKAVEITENGTVEVLPDEGYTLAKVAVTVEVPIPEGYVKPTGTLEVTDNGSYDVTDYSGVNVNVASGGVDGIPEGYARCDFIRFSGEQLVDSGIIGNQDTEINVCFARGESAQKYLFGCASSDNTAAITAYMAGTWRFGNKSASKALGTVNDRISYGALVSKSTISVSGAVSSISGVNDFETIGTLLLGGCRGASGALPTTLFNGRVSYFVVRQGGEQALKLVPITDGNGVYRFWDAVGKKFHDSITDTPLDGGNL